MPAAARPLLMAARAFLLDGGSHSRKPLFAGLDKPRAQLEAAAARCGLRLPPATAATFSAWHTRVRWTRLEYLVHTDAPDPARSGRACLTARPPAPDPQTTPPLYRAPYEQLRQRWSPVGPAPQVVTELLRAHLEGTVAHLPPVGSARRNEPATDLQLRYLRSLVERQLAVHVPPTEPGGHGHGHRLAVHPDILFALRLTDRPGPTQPDVPPLVQPRRRGATSSSSVTSATASPPGLT